MNNLLIIDSSSAILKLALVCADGIKSFVFDSQLKKHNSVLLQSVESLLLHNNLTIADISAIACVVGPGSFTGIRLGVSTANGLAVGLNVPRISINSLEGMAYGSKGNLVVAIDANHGNYYCGIYNDGNELSLLNMTADELSLRDNVIYNCDSYINNIANIAIDKFKKCEFVNQLQPLYMKLSQAERELDECTKG